VALYEGYISSDNLKLLHTGIFYTAAFITELAKETDGTSRTGRFYYHEPAKPPPDLTNSFSEL
jgi:hypothetical protein